MSVSITIFFIFSKVGLQEQEGYRTNKKKDRRIYVCADTAVVPGTAFSGIRFKPSQGYGMHLFPLCQPG